MGPGDPTVHRQLNRLTGYVNTCPYLYCVSLQRLLALTLALTHHQPEGSAARTNEKGALNVAPGAAARLVK